MSVYSTTTRLLTGLSVLVILSYCGGCKQEPSPSDSSLPATFVVATGTKSGLYYASTATGRTRLAQIVTERPLGYVTAVASTPTLLVAIEMDDLSSQCKMVLIDANGRVNQLGAGLTWSARFPMLAATGESVYTITAEGITRVSVQSNTFDVLVQSPVEQNVGLLIEGNTLFYGRNNMMESLDLNTGATSVMYKAAKLETLLGCIDGFVILRDQGTLVPVPVSHKLDNAKQPLGPRISGGSNSIKIVRITGATYWLAGSELPYQTLFTNTATDYVTSIPDIQVFDATDNPFR